jgi:hypothetical protein
MRTQGWILNELPEDESLEIPINVVCLVSRESYPKTLEIRKSHVPQLRVSAIAAAVSTRAVCVAWTHAGACVRPYIIWLRNDR